MRGLVHRRLPVMRPDMVLGEGTRSVRRNSLRNMINSLVRRELGMFEPMAGLLDRLSIRGERERVNRSGRLVHVMKTSRGPRPTLPPRPKPGPVWLAALLLRPAPIRYLPNRP